MALLYCCGVSAVKYADGARASSGLRSPAPPPAGLAPLEVVLYYLDFYDFEFSRTRTVVKGRARFVVVLGASLTSAIAVVGAITALYELPGLGVISALLAGCGAVLAAWDGLFKHRELWAQRSKVLKRIQQLRRDVEIKSATGTTDLERLSTSAMEALDKILDDDFVAWSQVRKGSSKHDGKVNGPEAGAQ